MAKIIYASHSKKPRSPELKDVYCIKCRTTLMRIGRSFDENLGPYTPCYCKCRGRDQFHAIKGSL